MCLCVHICAFKCDVTMCTCVSECAVRIFLKRGCGEKDLESKMDIKVEVGGIGLAAPG